VWHEGGSDGDFAELLGGVDQTLLMLTAFDEPQIQTLYGTLCLPKPAHLLSHCSTAVQKRNYETKVVNKF